MPQSLNFRGLRRARAPALPPPPFRFSHFVSDTPGFEEVALALGPSCGLICVVFHGWVQHTAMSRLSGLLA